MLVSLSEDTIYVCTCISDFVYLRYWIVRFDWLYLNLWCPTFMYHFIVFREIGFLDMLIIISCLLCAYFKSKRWNIAVQTNDEYIHIYVNTIVSYIFSTRHFYIYMYTYFLISFFCFVFHKKETSYQQRF